MWEINSLNQVLSFLSFFLTGGIFSLTYDIFRALRKTVKHSFAAVLLEDIFCFAVWSCAFFCLSLATVNGEIRLFALFGTALGFAVTMLTVSRFMLKLFTFALGLILGLITAISALSGRLSGCLNGLFGKIRALLRKKLKKAVKLCKKLLKIQ